MKTNLNFNDIVIQKENSQTPEITTAIKQIAHYERLGMTEAILSAKEAIVAVILQENGMRLLKQSTPTHWLPQLWLDQIRTDGVPMRLTAPSINGSWIRTPLEDYDGAVPGEALELLPKMLDRLFVFAPFSSAGDPILAFHMLPDILLKQTCRKWWGRKICKEAVVPSLYYAEIWKWE
jgi:hypothetical protein